ncbi:hypothetical protein A9Q84_12165 [Halobacteriovorax marinus]|uniref:Uncharacterized protein n=1 Tax=Halobacteriovorax marinus TaxID=97084 RepID=A0A1Y5FDN5_9BACT|nr:hypothetical protein A9Q84_12165 [Halobacteriovorax marinus]
MNTITATFFPIAKEREIHALEIINISKKVTKSDGTNNGIWHHGGSVDNDKEIIMAFSPTNYHSFLICGDHEFHPRLAYNNSKVLKTKRESIRAAVFIRIKGMSRKDLINFQKYLSKSTGKRSPSCHVGALRALKYGASVEITNVGMNIGTPLQTMTDILNNGFSHNGRQLDVECFTTRDKDFKAILKDVILNQRRYGLFFILSSFFYIFIKLFAKNKVIK